MNYSKALEKLLDKLSDAILHCEKMTDFCLAQRLLAKRASDIESYMAWHDEACQWRNNEIALTERRNKVARLFNAAQKSAYRPYCVRMYYDVPNKLQNFETKGASR